MVVPRGYQSDLLNETEHLWSQGFRNVVIVSPTGSGKTVMFSNAIQKEPGPSCATAHRKELVGQMSLALARNEVRHRIIAPDAVIRDIVGIHMDELGRSYYSPLAPAAVAGVDTLIRMDPTDPWFASVRLQVIDEAHHVLRANKWGRAAEMFPNARGLFVTATPERADRKGLGRHADGLADAMVIGPSMRDLINMTPRYLTDYRVICPKSNLDLSDVTLSAGGDFESKALRRAVHRSSITGDVVKSYLTYAFGKLGITFAVDIEHAQEIADRYNAHGVPAAVVTSETPSRERTRILREFKARKILQLVNVDLFGEGFDLPAIEVVSMARPTMSYSLYAQQFGRALRLLDGKTWAIIIDHVGNIQRPGFGLPDKPRFWTLDRVDKRARRAVNDAIPTRTCANPNRGDGVACASEYERVFPCCPYCGFEPVPADRRSISEVDGDLIELSQEVLAQMRGEIARVDGRAPVVPGLDQIAQRAVENNHHARQRAQTTLRGSIALWAGYQKTLGQSDQEIMRRFFHMFGVDIATAQTLKTADAEKLNGTISGLLAERGVIAA